jgi:pimeloyl-ACP methyl ester carboxylesterase
MNDVGELKRFVVVHARGQRIPRYQRILDRIRTDDRGVPGSWVWEWSTAAEGLRTRGRLLDACRHYNMARFPYVDGAARENAHERCVRAFDLWRSADPGIQRLDVETTGGRVRCWTSGLSADRPRPVVLVMGGIVTVKEQWAAMLPALRRLGLAGIATEMPGVGENTLRYDAKSWQMVPALLDAVADRADVSRTYALALSFSGHLALRCAVDDPRIRGVITVGAPISDFFTRPERPMVPKITLATLAHLTGGGAAGLADRMGDWALTDEQLAALEVPVRYVASRRDEIIPAGEVARLRRHVRDLRVLEHDDVHAAPRHTVETQLWMLRALIRMCGERGLQGGAVDLLFRAQRLRRRVTPHRA